jgi:hypothetical protein
MRTIDLDALSLEHNILLNKISSEIREDYNTAMEEVLRDHSDNIDWIVSGFANRDVHLNPMYFNCCYLALLQQLIDGGEPIEEVVVSSAAMGKVIGEYFSENGLPITIRVRGKSAFVQGVRRLYKYLGRFVIIAYHLVSRFVISRIMQPRYDFNGPLTLLDTFVLRDSFVDGEYKDRYYAGIVDFLDEEEKKATYFLPTFYIIRNYWSVFKDIRRSTQRFLIKDDFLKLSDYLYAFTYPARIYRGQLPEVRFRGLNLVALLRVERLYGSNTLPIMEGLLNYRLARRLRESGVKVKSLIDWYENQAGDRGLIRGFRKYYPETHIKGYAGYITSTSYNIHLHPTKFENDIGVVPHEIAVSGEGLTESTKEFCQDLNVSVSPSFRFREIFEERRAHPGQERFTILVSLPITIKDSVDILSVVADAAEELGSHFHFWIKPHPAAGLGKVRKQLGRQWPGNFETVEGAFHDCIQKADLMVGNFSSTCVEALAKGVPVVVIGARRGLTQNPIPDAVSRDIWTLCYTSDELKKAIESYADRDKGASALQEAVAEQIKDSYFSPVNPESARTFLDV